MVRTNSRTSGRRKYYARYIAHYTKKNYVVLLMGALFLLGVLMGTLLVRTAGGDTLELLLRMVGGHVEKRRGQTLYQNFFSGAAGSLVLIGGMFVCGFCAISQPITAAIPFFRGLGFGFSAASIYASYGAGATGYVAAFLLPGMILTTLVLLFCCNEALRLSGSILGLLRPGRAGQGEGPSLRIYCARFVVLAILGVASAFIEAVFVLVFSNSFLLF